MVGFCGRFGYTQYTPKKPVKWGIKAFTQADANTGYMLNILYTDMLDSIYKAFQVSLGQTQLT